MFADVSGSEGKKNPSKIPTDIPSHHFDTRTIHDTPPLPVIDGANARRRPSLDVRTNIFVLTDFATKLKLP
jgi:hypothetical protein